MHPAHQTPINAPAPQVNNTCTYLRFKARRSGLLTNHDDICELLFSLPPACQLLTPCARFILRHFSAALPSFFVCSRSRTTAAVDMYTSFTLRSIAGVIILAAAIYHDGRRDRSHSKCMCSIFARRYHRTRLLVLGLGCLPITSTVPARN